MTRWVLAGLLAAGAAGCHKGPSEDECKQLLDHMVDLEFKKAGTATSGDAKGEVAKEKANVVDAKLTEGFVEACRDKTPKARVECALAASDLDTSLAHCDEK